MMLERPDIDERELLEQVGSQFELPVAQLSFLPLGYDLNTAVYRVIATDGVQYFLKLRRGELNPITVEVPHTLSSLGIEAVIPPLPAGDWKLYGRFEAYTLILYPFVEGKDGYEVRLADQQWMELGSTLRKVHGAQLPPRVAQKIPHETFSPAWRESVKGFLSMAEQGSFSDPVAQKVAAFLNEKQQVIRQLVQRAEALAETVQSRPQQPVLCHTDAHPGNYHITPGGRLYLVDWDAPLFAPKERDLMFFGGGMAGDMPGGAEERMFYQGYGEVQVSTQALAYYRYERIIQDIAEFCKQLLLSEAGGEDREQAYHYLVSSFEPGHVLEAAMRTDEQNGKTNNGG